MHDDTTPTHDGIDPDDWYDTATDRPAAIDRAARVLGGGLLLLATVGLGLIELLDGPPHGAVPMTNEAGEVIAQPTVPPDLRAALIVGAVLIFGLYAIYRVVYPLVGDVTTGQSSATRSD